MPTPIEQLQAEHRIIEKALRALGGLSQRLEHGETVDPASIERIFDFLTAFADGRHHHKEEQCLFPALGLLGMPRDRGPVGVLLQEHCTGRALIAHMRRAASGLANGDAKAARQFADAAQNYIDLTTEHIQKEDGLLFRLAEQLLDGQAMQSLRDDFDQAEAGFAEDALSYGKEAEELERALAV